MSSRPSRAAESDSRDRGATSMTRSACASASRPRRPRGRPAVQVRVTGGNHVLSLDIDSTPRRPTLLRPRPRAHEQRRSSVVRTRPRRRLVRDESELVQPRQRASTVANAAAAACAETADACCRTTPSPERDRRAVVDDGRPPERVGRHRTTPVIRRTHERRRPRRSGGRVTTRGGRRGSSDTRATPSESDDGSSLGTCKVTGGSTRLGKDVQHGVPGPRPHGRSRRCVEAHRLANMTTCWSSRRGKLTCWRDSGRIPARRLLLDVACGTSSRPCTSCSSTWATRRGCYRWQKVRCVWGR